MKVCPFIVNYVDQNKSYLSLGEKMSLNGFINVTSTLMLRRLLNMTSSNWPLLSRWNGFVLALKFYEKCGKAGYVVARVCKSKTT